MTFNLENQNRVKEDIVFFENFLTEEQCSNVIKYWEHSAEKGTLPWAPISFYDSFASNLPDDDDKEKFGLEPDFLQRYKIKFKRLQKYVEEIRLSW